MAAQPPELALDPVLLTSEPPGPNEPWSFHPSDLPAESPPALTNLADPGSFNLAGSSAAAAQMVASPQALPETVIPFLDAAGDLPPEPDPFAVPLQDPQDQVTQHQRLPEVVPVLSWDQNQALTLPPPLEILTAGLDQAHPAFEILVPPLGSTSSKPATLIVSPPHLELDPARLPLLVKVAGTPGQLAKTLQGLQQLQDDSLDPSMDVIYPEENLPVCKFLVGPR